MTKDEIITLAEKHCYCSSADHKEFLHEDLIAFAEQLLENERKRSPCSELRGALEGKTIDSTPLTDKQIASACLSYRHDFGLLSPQEQKSMMFQAREWEQALRKEI